MRDANKEDQTERHAEKQRGQNTGTDIAVACCLQKIIYKLSRGDEDKENDVTASGGIGNK